MPTMAATAKTHNQDDRLRASQTPRKATVVRRTTIGKYFAGLAAALGKTVLWVVVILIVTAYLLIDIDRISAKILSLMTPARRESAKRISAELGGVLAGYVRGVVIVSALYGICATIIFLVFGTKYALVIGLIAGVLYIVPYIGAIITLFVVMQITGKVDWSNAFQRARPAVPDVPPAPSV